MEELKVKISVKILPGDYSCDGKDISPEIDVGGVKQRFENLWQLLLMIPMLQEVGVLFTG